MKKMSKIKDSGLMKKTADILWGLVLLTIPVTSFRYFPEIFRGTIVQPLAVIPLALLGIVLLILIIKSKKIMWPLQTTQLTVFLFAVLISSILGLLLAPVSVRGQVYEVRSMKAWVSLFIGLAFFVITYLQMSSEYKLRKSMGWMFAGLSATLLWSGLQALAIHTPLIGEETMNIAQLQFSLRQMVNHRLSGLAYEPSWLAAQLTILYFPWLTAYLLSGYKAKFKKWLAIILLVVGWLVLFLTYSRTGLLVGFASTFVGVVAAGGSVIQKGFKWFLEPFRNIKINLGLALRIIIIIGIIGVVWVGFAILSRNEYISNIWNASLDQGIVSYFINNFAGGRLAYVVAGFETFDEHPWFGVGLGGAGFYMYEHMPAWAQTGIPEISEIMSPESGIFLNVKNMYVRLMAETGVVGLFAFLAFLFSILASGLNFIRNGSVFGKFVGIAAVQTWVALIITLFSRESLTFPVMWVSIGIIAGLAARQKKNMNNSELIVE